jgi:hypothetical protein
MSGKSHPAPKPCVTCGREITWRKKWEKNWADIKYCSDACRRGVRPIDTTLEQAILQLLDARERQATICPSEAARLVSPGQWQELMEPARRAARRLVASGKIVITQGGRVVDPSTAKGPIRLRKK